jgi:hypothetical protein
MKECSNNKSLEELISNSQIARFAKSLDDLKTATSIILNNSQDNTHSGKVAFDALMMLGTIAAAWQMLKSLERANNAFKHNSVSSEFLEKKTETVKHFLDFILPRYLANFATICATSE